MLVFSTASFIVIISGIIKCRGEIETARNNAMLLALSLAAQQEQVAIEIRQTLSTLSLLPGVKNLDPIACNDIFRQLQDDNPMFTTINAATCDGAMFAASVPFDNVNVADRKHCTDAAATLDLSSGEYTVGKISDTRSINYTLPVLNSAKVPVAFITAGFNLDYFSSFVEKIKHPEGYEFAILDHSGIRLYRIPEHAATFSGKQIPQETFKKISSDIDCGTFESTTEDGISRIYAFKQLRLRNDAVPYMYLLVGVPSDKIIQKSHSDMLITLSLLGITAAISFLLVWFLGRPISRLSAAAQRLGGGDLAARTSLPHTLDDLGQLARSFDHMASMLERSARESTNAEEAVRESESKYRNLVETTGTGYLIIDLQGKVLDANQEYAGLAGYGSVQEILGRSVLEWTAPHDRERNAEAWDRCVADGLTRNLEIDYTDRDGRITPVEINATLIETTGGTVIICLIKNITERRRTEAELQQAYDGLEGIVARRTAELSEANDRLRSEIETRKKVEGALRESEHRFRSLFEGHRATMLLVDPDSGAILDVNEAGSQFYGFSKTELCAMNIAQINQLPEDEIAQARLSILERKANSYVFPHRLRSGEVRTVEVDSSPIEMKGRIVLFSIIHDITERKLVEDKCVRTNESLQASYEHLNQEIAVRLQVEAALRESRQELENIIDFLPDATFVINSEGKVIAWNKTIEELTGLKASDMLGKGDYEYSLPFHGEKRPILIDLVLKPQEEIEAKYLDVERTGTGLTAQIHATGLVKEGVSLFLDLAASVLRGSDGRILGAIESMRDFSEMKKAREELERTNVEMAQMVASIPSFLIGLTPQCGIARWNRAAERIFGISRGDVLGKQIDECGLQWDWPKIAETIRICQTNNVATRLGDMRFRRPDGKEGFLGITVSAIEGSQQKPPGILLLGNDTTQQKILESQLVQAQKLESIGQLAAGIAHEINTPAQYVGDNARFLLEAYGDLERVHDLYDRLLVDLGAGNPTEPLVRKIEEVVREVDLGYIREEVPKAVRQSIEGIERISRIVRAMKDFSHPGTEAKTEIDLNKAIESTITVARNEWKYFAEMVTDFDPALPFVPCLPAEINQVILNVIINAAHAVADALKQKGTDTLGTITVTTRALGEQAEIRISDSGTGIPEKIRSKIFDPFFTTKEVGKGTGQGLAISRSVVVDKHGGTITFDSEIGRGTTFIIRLPLNRDGSEN